MTEMKTERKQTAFRLRADLLAKLKIEAKKQNRSLNNYVESVLKDSIPSKPISTIKEAMEAKDAGIIDQEQFDALMRAWHGMPA